MNIMCRQVLLLVGIGTIVIAIPQLASAFDPDRDAAVRLAMGPMSAAQKNRGQAAATPDTTASTCAGGTCRRPHHHRHHARRRHVHSK
jgi:hypothetical protein